MWLELQCALVVDARSFVLLEVPRSVAAAYVVECNCVVLSDRTRKLELSAVKLRFVEELDAKVIVHERNA